MIGLGFSQPKRKVGVSMCIALAAFLGFVCGVTLNLGKRIWDCRKP